MIPSESAKEDARLYDCWRCEFVTNSWYEHCKHHQREHGSQEFYKCDKCNYTSKSKALLQFHCRNEHSNQQFPMHYGCLLCSYSTNDTGNWNRHVRLRHRTEMQGNFPLRPKINADAEIELYKCDICHYTTDAKRNLTRHVWRQHPSKHQAEKLVNAPVPLQK